MNNPLDEETKAQMQEKIQETMTTFATNYTNSFKNALISKCSEEAEESPYQLIDAPLATDPLKEDFMMKLGAVRKNWKKRWFVAYNEADNFTIKYYATKAKKKLKGEISLCGYQIRDFTEEEKKKTGDNGIALFKEGAREWKVRCVPDNDENNKAWKGIFQDACKKARPPIGANDKVAGDAFMGAYAATRSEHGIECAEHPTGTEEEALSSLIMGAIASLVATVMEKIPDGPTKGMATKAANTGIGALVKTAVIAGWKSMTTAMASTRPMMESGIKAAIAPINEAKGMLNDKAAALCDAIIKPVMDTAVTSKLQPVLGKISGPCAAGYVEAVTYFSEKAKEVVDKTKKDAASLQDNAKSAYYDVWWKTLNSLEPLLDALGSVGDALGDFPAADIVGNIKDQMQILIKKGIATMVNAIEADKKSPDEAYAETLAKVVHDACRFLADTMKSVLTGLIKPQFDAEVKPLCMEPIAPVDEAIPEPVKAFVTMEAVVDGVLDSVIDTAVSGIVDPIAEAETAKIEALSASLA
jgi:hypothetical protein